MARWETDLSPGARTVPRKGSVDFRETAAVDVIAGSFPVDLDNRAAKTRTHPI